MRKNINKITCDICGKAEEYPRGWNSLTIGEKTEYIDEEFNDSIRWINPFGYDLCKECYKEIKEFIEKRKVNKDE